MCCGANSARPPPLAQWLPHPLALAGTAPPTKLPDVQKKLKDDGQHAVVLTLPDSICWLLNIRGSDVAHNPVVLAFAIVPVTGKAELFIDAAKIDAAARAHLNPVAKDQRARSAGRTSQSPCATQAALCASILIQQQHGSNALSALRRLCVAKTLASCRKPSRQLLRSRARATRTSATARPWCASSRGSMKRLQRAISMKSPPSKQLEEFRSEPACSKKSASRRSQAPDRTAQSSTIA